MVVRVAGRLHARRRCKGRVLGLEDVAADRGRRLHRFAPRCGFVARFCGRLFVFVACGGKIVRTWSASSRTASGAAARGAYTSSRTIRQPLLGSVPMTSA